MGRKNKKNFLKNNVESLGIGGIGGITSITYSYTEVDGKGLRPSGLRTLGKGNISNLQNST